MKLNGYAPTTMVLKIYNAQLLAIYFNRLKLPKLHWLLDFYHIWSDKPWIIQAVFKSSTELELELTHNTCEHHKIQHKPSDRISFASQMTCIVTNCMPSPDKYKCGKIIQSHGYNLYMTTVSCTSLCLCTQVPYDGKELNILQKTIKSSAFPA